MCLCLFYSIYYLSCGCAWRACLSYDWGVSFLDFVSREVGVGTKLRNEFNRNVIKIHGINVIFV